MSGDTPSSYLSTSVLEAMSEAFISLTGDRLSYFNSRAQTLLGLDHAELYESQFWEVLPSWVGGDLYWAVQAATERQTACEVEQYHPATKRWLGMRLAPQGDTVNIFFKDVTDQKRAQQAREQVHVSLQGKLKMRSSELERLNEKLLHDSLHDALTGLPNRTYLLDALRRALAANEEQAVLVLDFDGFKFINDSFGYAVGDELLIALSKRLRNVVSGGEFLAHIGGDEFAILLGNVISTSQLLAVVERLQASLARPFAIRDYSLYISVSIGVVSSLGHYHKAEDVLRDADTAMYQAKRSGKGHYTLFDKALRDRILSRVSLEADLRFAAERGELLVHFQPIMDVATLETTGFETLVRWQHPTKGLIAPDHFIPIAEESGFVTSIDMWVVHTACECLKAWRNPLGGRPLCLNVNFSGRHFARPNLHGQLETILSKTGVSAQHLNIEITETVLMDDTLHTQQSLAGLRDLGVNLHIDDFGTGYSSLSYLQRFPAQCLKLDRSFTRRLGEPKGAQLVSSLVNMAHSLEMSVTTEGIETAQQLEVLRSLGCDFAQGFFLARPMPAPEALNFLQDQRSSGR